MFFDTFGHHFREDEDLNYENEGKISTPCEDHPKLYKELDFDKEKDYLINSLKIVDEYEKDYIVNNFHGRVRNKTFKQVVNFHTSYHLNQFGVL